MEDRLDDPLISALSPATGPTFPAAGSAKITMVAPADKRVGNIRRHHLHRPCDTPDRRSGPLARKAAGFAIQRASYDAPRGAARSIVRAIAGQGGGRGPAIAMTTQGWASRALWLMFCDFCSLGGLRFWFALRELRADGTGELFCFVIALFFGSLEILVFVIATAAKFLMLILP
jgi:hypothetical protein